MQLLPVQAVHVFTKTDIAAGAYLHVQRVRRRQKLHNALFHWMDLQFYTRVDQMQKGTTNANSNCSTSATFPVRVYLYFKAFRVPAEAQVYVHVCNI